MTSPVDVSTCERTDERAYEPIDEYAYERADEHAYEPADEYLHERYLGTPRRRPALTAYYAVKPLIPRRLQLRVRRAYARRQATRAFPRWPIETVLVERAHARLGRCLASSPDDAVPLLGYWPQPYLAACILTHDVEGPLGIRNIPRVLELERRHGLVSSWNFVAEDYPIPAGTFAAIRTAGGEVGLHGIRHDGKLFQSRARFDSDLPKIHAYLRRWGADGFRSPATHRRAPWMHELGCLYDSSYPDTDPFEPQPGGCCSILPFMFGDVVELPLTMVQDHTLWEILERDTIDLWRQKATWLIANHGLVTVNTHPDYLTSADRLARYDELLTLLADQPACWHALPRDVARWWRARERMGWDVSRNPPRITGECCDRAAVWWASERNGAIRLELAAAPTEAQPLVAAAPIEAQPLVAAAPVEARPSMRA